MKLNHVPTAATFIQGVGQYTYNEMLAGLSWLSSTEEDLLAGLRGVGALSGASAGSRGLGGLSQGADQFVAPQSVMDAIIKNAKEMKDKQKFLAAARMEMAKNNPEFAMRLNAVMKKTAAPGTNVAAGVVQTAAIAAQKAIVAKGEESEAKKLLKQNDKRGAAAMAVKALQTAREAVVLSTKAEKTRLAVSLDSVAGTLEAQAKYVDAITEAEMIARGTTPRVDALRASALSLREQATKLRAQSAVVQAAPEVPPTAPSNRRIAEVANKFNLRSAGRGVNEYDAAIISTLGQMTRPPQSSGMTRPPQASGMTRPVRAEVVSVLADLSNSALAQVHDYEGAMMFYGRDLAGKLMADIEFENSPAALQGLAQGVHGVGYTDTLPVFARADRVLAEGIKAAQQGYMNAVLPAYMGQNPNLSKVQATVAQLGGLNLAGLGGTQEEWGGWCDRQVNSGRPGSESITAAYKGDVNMCKKWGIFYSEPWSCKGIWERGGMDIGAMAICMVKGVPAFFASGEAQKVLKTVDDTAKAFTPPPAAAPPAAAPPAAAPPPATRPPPTLPVPEYQPPGPISPSRDGYRYGNQGYGNQAMSGGGNTMLYAGVGLGVAALGFGVWYTMIRRPSV